LKERLEEALDPRRILRDRGALREDDMGNEMRRVVLHADEDAAVIVLFETEARLGREYDGIDLMRPHRRDARLDRAKRHGLDAILAPAFLNGHLLRQPVAERADTRDGDHLAL